MNALPQRTTQSQEPQRTFRALLQALSRPGEMVTMSRGTGIEVEAPACTLLSAALCLVDHEVSIWLDPTLDSDEVRHLLLHQAGASLCAAGKADIALIGNPRHMPALEDFRDGTAQHPDRAALLLVQLPSLHAGEPVTLRGPGIQRVRTVCLDGLPTGFWTAWDINAAKFPTGVDIVFFSGSHLLGLPRSSRRIAPC